MGDQRWRRWVARRLGVVSPSQAYPVRLDLRGGCRMALPECPERCPCPFDLWAWVRPRMAQAITAARMAEAIAAQAPEEDP